MTTLALSDLRRDESLRMIGRVTDMNAVLRSTPERIKLAPTLTNIEVNTTLAEMFHANRSEALELAGTWGRDRWPADDERRTDK